MPKHHGAKLTDIPDDALAEILVRKILYYNIYQIENILLRARTKDKIARREETGQSYRGGELQCAAEQWTDCTSGC